MVSGYQAAAAAGTMTEAQAKKAAAEAIRLARYDTESAKPDHFFVLTTAGVGVMHPYLKTWDGQASQLGILNKQRFDTVKAMVDAVAASKTDPTHVQLMIAKNGDQDSTATLYPKLHCLVKVLGWDWIVGSGLCMDDVEGPLHTAVLQETAWWPTCSVDAGRGRAERA
jgi:methyl-accepting chemotaxis protein